MRLLFILTFLSIVALGAPAAIGSPALAHSPVQASPSTAAVTAAPTHDATSISTPAAPHVSPRNSSGNGSYQHQCREVNQTICVEIDSQSASTDIVPHFPNATAPRNQSPAESDDLYLDVLSEYNISNTSVYCGGPSCPASLGASGEYIGLDAYVYVSVTDVLWNGVSWFCTCDDSVWHADAGQNWAPDTNTYIGTNKSFYNYEYTLLIAATAANTANNFPNGTFVQWNVTVSHFSGGKWYHNSTQQWSVSPFSYFISDAWYWSTAYGTAYPNNRPPSVAFAEDLNMTYSPVSPQVGSTVVVYINITTWDQISGGLIDSPSLVLKVWYPNGTFWRSWAAPFAPNYVKNFPATNATLTLPEPFFANAGEKVIWQVTAFDQAGDEIQSNNVTQIVNTNGLFNGTFSQNLAVTTDPTDIGALEDQNGTILGTIPAVALDSTVNVTVTSLNQTVGIQAVWIYIRVDYPQAGLNETTVDSMHRITQIHYYYVIPQLPPETNVTFFLRAFDYNETSLISHNYRYFVPLTETPTGSLGFFYVEVYDAATGLYPSGANVSIIGLAGTVNIQTKTQYGIAFPNVTGEPDEPYFLQANSTYRVTVQYPAFTNQQSNPVGNSLTVSFELLHVMNLTQQLSEGPNWQVVERGDIIFFSLNTVGPPPVYATSVNQDYLGIALWGGLAVAVAMLYPVYSMWKEMRARAEAEEKRITL